MRQARLYVRREHGESHSTRRSAEEEKPRKAKERRGGPPPTTPTKEASAVFEQLEDEVHAGSVTGNEDANVER